MNQKSNLQLLIFLISSLFIAVDSWSVEQTKDSFDIRDNGNTNALINPIKPWKVITLDQEYGGLWVVAGDIDGDGEVEVVSSENFSENDVHHTTTAVAQKLDGSVLWKWGDPDKGRKIWHHDVACQIHDWDNDGNTEVILCGQGFLVELDGKTGKEKRRIAIPIDASDCLVFCDLSGKGHPSDVLVKNRYRQIWAYDYHGNLLWTCKDPGGYRTAHHPYPIDIDNDGRDEIMAGYAMLNSDGSVRWIYQSKTVDQARGHLDCVRVVRPGKEPSDFRLALTCCGANNIAMVDGNGATVWEVSGHHFESINIARIDPNRSGVQILVDIDHKPLGESPIWILDEDGKRMGQIIADYCRHHKLVDWTGDGFAEIFIAHNRAIYDYQGRRIATLSIPKSQEDHKGEDSILQGDFTGDGIADVMIATPQAVYIFKNENGKQSVEDVPFGTGLNFSLY